jgi:amino acid transporter
MCSVTMAASAANYRRGALRLRVNGLGLLQTVARSIAVMMTAVCYSAGVRGSRTGVSSFKIPLSLGAMISFFSLAPSYVNAGARIMLPMGEHGFFPKRLRVVDVRDLTHAPQSASASA